MNATELIDKAKAEARKAFDGGASPVEAGDVAMEVVLNDLHAMLFPEQHPDYDPEHVYWQGSPEAAPGQDAEPFQWSADTIEWVAQWLDAVRTELERRR